MSYHGEKKERYHVKEHKKLCCKLMSKMSLHFVEGHHSEKQAVVLVGVSFDVVAMTTIRLP